MIIIVTQCHHHKHRFHSHCLTVVTNSVQSQAHHSSVQLSSVESVQTYFKFSRMKTRRSNPLVILFGLPAVRSPETLNTRSVYACDTGMSKSLHDLTRAGRTKHRHACLTKAMPPAGSSVTASAIRNRRCCILLLKYPPFSFSCRLFRFSFQSFSIFSF